MASKRQLGGNLGHLKANLRPTRGQDSFGSEGVGGMREALLAPQEGNSEIKPCPSGRNLTQLRPKGRRRIQSLRAFRQARLKRPRTATT